MFEHEEKYYYKPIRIGPFWSNNFIEYKRKYDRKKLSVDECLNKVRS